MLPTVNDLQLVETLTGLLVGYLQSDDRFVADRIFRPLTADYDSGTYAIFTKKYWFLDGLEQRAAGSHFKRSGYGVSSATFTTLQWGLEHVIPDENRANNQTPMSLEQAGLQWLATQSLIRRERAFATDFWANNVWETTDNNSATDWDDTVSGDPITNVRTAARTISQSTGQDANTIAMGEIVYDALLVHPDIIDKLKYTAAATLAQIRQSLAAVLGLENLYVSRAIYNSANPGQSASMAAIIDDDALVCYVSPGEITNMTATAGKTFVWEGGGGIGSAGMYREPQTKSDVIQHNEQWDQVAVATDLGYLFLDIV